MTATAQRIGKENAKLIEEKAISLIQESGLFLTPNQVLRTLIECHVQHVTADEIREHLKHRTKQGRPYKTTD